MNYSFYQQPFPEMIVDNELILREQRLEDANAFFEYYSDADVSRYILASAPRNLTEAIHEIHYCRNMFYQQTGLYWALAIQENDYMIGAIGLYINSQHNRAELCYDLHKDYWRRGIMFRAINKVIAFSFSHLCLNRLEAITVKENLPSMAILNKLGFHHEGTLSNYRQYKNRAYDVELFGLTSELYQKSNPLVVVPD